MDHRWSHALLTKWFGWIKSDWEWKRKRPVKVKTRLGQFFPSSATQRGPSWTNLSDRIWPIRGHYSAPTTNQKPPFDSVMILSLTDFLSVSDPAKVWQQQRDQERVEMERVMMRPSVLFVGIFPPLLTLSNKRCDPIHDSIWKAVCFVTCSTIWSCFNEARTETCCNKRGDVSTAK